MSEYVLGQSVDAAHRLAVQDAALHEASEWLLDQLALPPTGRVVELGCGPGSFSRRVLHRMQPGGLLIGVDASDGLLAQARTSLSDTGIFQTLRADVSEPGSWLTGADAVIGRAILHHLPLAECFLGRLRSVLKPGTKIGFLEPDFRTPLARLAALEAAGRPELASLRVWISALNQLYAANRISPAVGATLAASLEMAGYRQIRSQWWELPTDATMLENMRLIYLELRNRYQEFGILTTEETDQQRRLIEALKPNDLPGVWGLFTVIGEV